MPSQATPPSKSKKLSKGRMQKSMASSTTPSGHRSTPVSHTDMSEAERVAFRQRLDQTDKYFSIAMSSAPQGKKRKRVSSTMQVQTDIFASRLDVEYEVLPRGHWEKIKKYKKFTVGSESIATGECILVKYDDGNTTEVSLDITEQWKAKVLEVRALDEEHVYLRISWLNRPEDLPGGRQPHHGRLELIPSNEMDVIDAMTVNGRLEVVHWDESQEDAILPAADQFFWRQTLDFTTGKLSEHKKICRDKQPQNPDELILQCANPKCRQWLHVKCIAEEAVIRASAKDETTPSKDASKPTRVQIEPTSSAQAKAKKDTVTAEVFIQGLPAENKFIEPAESTRIVINSENPEQSSEQPIKCLFCEEVIE